MSHIRIINADREDIGTVSEHIVTYNQSKVPFTLEPDFIQIAKVSYVVTNIWPPFFVNPRIDRPPMNIIFQGGSDIMQKEIKMFVSFHTLVIISTKTFI